jgi:hypothetical protein
MIVRGLIMIASFYSLVRANPDRGDSDDDHRIYDAAASPARIRAALG